jgi:hypothetical protein
LNIAHLEIVVGYKLKIFPVTSWLEKGEQNPRLQSSNWVPKGSSKQVLEAEFLGAAQPNLMIDV